MGKVLTIDGEYTFIIVDGNIDGMWYKDRYYHLDEIFENEVFHEKYHEAQRRVKDGSA